MGMSEDDYTYLCTEIDVIIHAAAYVNLIYPYQVLTQFMVWILWINVKYNVDYNANPKWSELNNWKLMLSRATQQKQLLIDHMVNRVPKCH